MRLPVPVAGGMFVFVRWAIIALKFAMQHEILLPVLRREDLSTSGVMSQNFLAIVAIVLRVCFKDRWLGNKKLGYWSSARGSSRLAAARINSLQRESPLNRRLRKTSLILQVSGNSWRSDLGMEGGDRMQRDSFSSWRCGGCGRAECRDGGRRNCGGRARYSGRRLTDRPPSRIRWG